MMLSKKEIQRKQKVCRMMRSIGVFCSLSCVGFIGLGLLVRDFSLVVMGILLLPLNIIGVMMQDRLLSVLDMYSELDEQSSQKKKIDELYGR